MLGGVIEVAQISGASTALLCSLLFVWLGSVPRISRGTNWWAIGLFVDFCGFIVSISPSVALFGVEINQYVYLSSECFLSVCMLLGTRLFVGRPTNKFLLFLSAGIAGGLIVVFGTLFNSFLAVITIASLFNGVFISFTGITIVRSVRNGLRLHKYVVGAIFFIWGIHWFDAPFMMHDDVLFEYGFFFALLISSIAIIGYSSLMISSLIRRVLNAEREAVELSLTDALTSLGNRRYLENMFAKLRNNAKRFNHKMALIFIDLNRFKQVNDTFGHDVGDDLLKLVSTRMKDMLRDSDFIFRLGGDEFLIFIPELEQDEDALTLINRLHEKILLPYQIGDNEVEVGASIGVAFYPEHGSSLEDLLVKADRAMYRAKETGVISQPLRC